MTYVAGVVAGGVIAAGGGGAWVPWGPGAGAPRRSIPMQACRGTSPANPSRIRVKLSGPRTRSASAEPRMPRFKNHESPTTPPTGTSGWRFSRNRETIRGDRSPPFRTITVGARFPSFNGSGGPTPGCIALGPVAAHRNVAARLPPETLRRRLNDELTIDHKNPRRLPGPAPLTRAPSLRSPAATVSDCPAAGPAFAQGRLSGGFSKESARRAAHARTAARMRRPACVDFDRRGRGNARDERRGAAATLVLVDASRLIEDGDLLLVSRSQGSHFPVEQNNPPKKKGRWLAADGRPPPCSSASGTGGGACRPSDPE